MTRRYDAPRRSETICAAGLADELMADKKRTDPRIRSDVVTRFLSRLVKWRCMASSSGCAMGMGITCAGSSLRMKPIRQISGKLRLWLSGCLSTEYSTAALRLA